MILCDAMGWEQGWIMQQSAPNGASVLKLVCFTFLMSLAGHHLICMHNAGVIVASNYYFCDFDVLS